MTRSTIPAVLLALVATGSVPMVANAQDGEGPGGYLTLGAAYSERYGETAFVGLDVQDLFGTGISARANAEYSRSGYRLSVDLDKAFTFSMPGMVADPYVTVSTYLGDHAWQGAAYFNKRMGLSADVIFPLRENLTLSAGYFYYDDTISNVAATTSPLIAAEAGQQAVSGLSLGILYDTTDSPMRPGRGMALGLDARYAGLGGDVRWSALSASADIYQPLPMDGIASLKLSGGRMQSLDGNPIRISDRAFLGYDLPRGFAFGGLGPRDVAGPVNSALGGENYLTASLATDFPLFDAGSGTVYGGVFWEGGSVWGLQNTTGAAMGTVDDAQYWRASYGVSLSWAGSFGQVSLSWADPYMRRPEDIAQPVSLTFSTSF